MLAEMLVSGSGLFDCSQNHLEVCLMLNTIITIAILLLESAVAAGFIVYLQFAKPELVKKLEPFARVVFFSAAALSALVIFGAKINVPSWTFKFMLVIFLVPMAIATNKNDRKDSRQPNRRPTSTQTTSLNHHQATPPDHQ
jgi:hypothetical protein